MYSYSTTSDRLGTGAARPPTFQVNVLMIHVRITLNKICVKKKAVQYYYNILRNDSPKVLMLLKWSDFMCMATVTA